MVQPEEEEIYNFRRADKDCLMSSWDAGGTTPCSRYDRVPEAKAQTQRRIHASSVLTVA